MHAAACWFGHGRQVRASRADYRRAWFGEPGKRVVYKKRQRIAAARDVTSHR